MSNIIEINILFENGDNVIITKDECKEFYISNFNSNGEEIPYEQTIIKNKLSCNFCMFNLFKNIAREKVERIKNKYDIFEIQLLFDDSRYLKFDVPSDADPFADNYHNNYEMIIENDNSFGILLSRYKIKYVNNLFT